MTFRKLAAKMAECTFINFMFTLVVGLTSLFLLDALLLYVTFFPILLTETFGLGLFVAVISIIFVGGAGTIVREYFGF